MKKQTFILLAIVLLAIQTFETNGQKRLPVTRKTTVTKPAPAPISTPAPTPKPVEISPAQAFFNEGLKCAAEDYDCQISNYTKAINLDLNTKEVFKNRGNAYLQRKDFDKAIADFTKLIELDLNDASGYKNRGRIYLENSNSPQAVNAAIKDFTSAIDLEPKDVEAYKLRSSAYMKLRDYDKAEADMDKIAAIEPNNVGVIINQGEMFLANKQYDKAIEAFNKAGKVALVSNVYLSRGITYASQNKYNLAISDFNKGSELDAQNADVYFQRGNVYYLQRKYDLAIADFNKAIELIPNRAEIYFIRGKAHQNKSNYKLSLTDFNKAIELEPNNSDYYVSKDYSGRGGFYKAIGQYKKCQDDASKAIALNPNNYLAYHFRGNCLLFTLKYGSDEYTKGQVQYESDMNQFKSIFLKEATQEVRYNPQSSKAYIDRASAYSGDSQTSLALNDYNKAIELDPQNATAYYLRASLYQHSLKMKDLALKDLNTAIEIDPDNADFYGSRSGLFRHEFKDTISALKDLLKAIELNSNAEQLYFELAQIYEQEGKNDLAINSKLKYYEFSAKDYTKKYEFEPSESSLKGLIVNLLGSGEAVSAFDLYVTKFCKIYSDKCFQDVSEFYLGVFKMFFFLISEEVKEVHLEKALPFYTNAIKENPQNVMNYLWRAEILNELGLSKEAIIDFTKCTAIDEGKGRYCKGRIESIKSDIAIAGWERKRLKREKRNQALLQVMGAITKGLETYNTARQNSSTSQTPQPNTSSRPQTTQSGGTSTTVNKTNENSGDTVTGCNDGITRGGTGFDCHQFVTSGHIVHDESIRAGYWEDVCKDSICSQWAKTPLSQILFRGKLGRDKFAKDKQYIWTIGFKNTSNSVVVFFPDLIYGDGTTQQGDGVALTPGSETTWNVTWGTNSGSSEISIRIRKYAICSSITRITDNGRSGYKCN